MEEININSIAHSGLSDEDLSIIKVELALHERVRLAVKKQALLNRLVSSDDIKTGDIIKINLNNSKIYQYKIAYLGDTSGDGKINYLDYVKIYNKIKELKGESN